MPGISHPASPDDPQASLRTELLGQLVAAQFSLDAVIAELERSGAPLDAARRQLHAIGDMQRTVGAASPAALIEMRGAIVAAASAAQMFVEQARTATAPDNAMLELADAAAEARATVQRISADLFERKIFDPYLQFDSEEEERAYRKREAEREAYIKRELAKGTPEGMLNAITATREQIEDAGRHDADRSPDYAQLLNQAKADEEALRSEMARASFRDSGQPKVAPASHDTREELGDVLAALRDAGVVTADATSADADHGLTVAKPATPFRQV